MAHDVFVSYASADKPTADAVCAALESRRIRCWIAPRDVLPGADYAASLIDAISLSRVFVLVLSSNSNQSPHVMREVERAVTKAIPIIPLRIENVALTKSMEYYLSSRHWLDALTPPLENHLSKLAETVIKLLEVEAAYGATAMPPAQTATKRPASISGGTSSVRDQMQPASMQEALVGGACIIKPSLISFARYGRRELSQLFERRMDDGYKHFVLELPKGLLTIDSGSMQIVAGWTARLRMRSGIVALVVPPPRPTNLSTTLRMSGLDKIAEVYDSVDLALANLLGVSADQLPPVQYMAVEMQPPALGPVQIPATQSNNVEQMSGPADHVEGHDSNEAPAKPEAPASAPMGGAGLFGTLQKLFRRR